MMTLKSEPQTPLAYRLRSLRQQQRYSARGLSKAAGVTCCYLLALEKGLVRGTSKPMQPSPTVLRRIGAVLGLGAYETLMHAAGYLAETSVLSREESTDSEALLVRYFRAMAVPDQTTLLDLARLQAERQLRKA